MSDTLNEEAELPLSMTSLTDRRKREVRMFKSICVKLIMSDITIADHQFTLASCKEVLEKFKEAVNTRLIQATDEQMNIITKLFKSVAPIYLKRCLFNLVERALTHDMIQGLMDVPVSQPANLAEIFWFTYQQISVNYANLEVNPDVKRTFVKNIIDDMEQFLILTEQEAILRDLNILEDKPTGV